MTEKKEYIEREATLRNLADDLPYKGSVKRVLMQAPAADVVEVVRCRDCVNYCGFEHCKNGICDVDPVSKRAVNPTDFCSHGERKERG